MELKPPNACPKGYQQTKVGTIPEDWEVTPLIQAVGRYIDYRGRTPKKLGLSWGGGNILALSANNVQMGKIDPNKEANLGSEELYKKWMVQGECDKGDILLTTEAPLGNIAQIPDSRKYILSQRVLLIKPKEWLLRDFLAHYMRGAYFQNELFLNSTGSTAKGIQRRKLEDIEIYLPPTKAEQETIARVLSNADALIESLEQLIVKKRRLNQGAMQELLTGRKRLPGFRGKWDQVSVGELFSFKNGLNKAKKFFGYGTPIVNYMDVFKSPKIYCSDLKGRVFLSKQEINNFNVQRGDVLFTRTSETAEEIGMASVILDEPSQTVFSGFVLRGRPKNERLHDEFKAYCFRSESIRRQIVSKASYTTRALTNGRILSAILLAVPNADEQIAIASTLSDMDSEITTLEAKLAKYCQLKQGMMHNLLTGKIRLLEPAISKVKRHGAISEESLAATIPRTHSWAFNEAVIISVLADQFGSAEFPLGRKRCTKLSYLTHRKTDQQVQGYLKKAAGPYNPRTKYAGPEKIAQENGYVRNHQREAFKGLIAAENIQEAKNYFVTWYGLEILKWLEQFRRKTNDQLERLATVDMAVQELLKQGQTVDVDGVRALIASQPEWLPKLERPVFSDSGIAAAIAECYALFG